MTWVDILLIAAFVGGLVAGGLLVARSPTFWVGLLMVVISRAQPYLVLLLAWLTRPLAPEDQKKLDTSRRRAEEWDFARKRPKENPK